MKTELIYLVYVSLFTAVLWAPYVLNRMMVCGITDTVGYPDKPSSLAPWAERMTRAHRNAVENLAVFAALVLVADAANVSTEATAMAAMIYFWARVVHLVAYTLAIPWVRTLGFVTGFVCQVVIAVAILG